MSKLKLLKRDENTFDFVEGGSFIIEELDCHKIYTLSYSQNRGFYLTSKNKTKLTDAYNTINPYYKRLAISYENCIEEKNSLAALFYGKHGTGKTYAMKCIAQNLSNSFKIPIVCITNRIPLNDVFFNIVENFPSNAIFMIDEVEKIFPSLEINEENDQASNDSYSFLSLLDGVINNTHLWLFTSNSELNNHLTYRSKRVKYIFDFNIISDNVIDLYINKNVKYPECKDKVKRLVDIYNIYFGGITFDNLATIVEEYNLFGKEMPLKNILDLNLFIHKSSFLSFDSFYIKHKDSEDFIVINDHSNGLISIPIRHILLNDFSGIRLSLLKSDIFFNFIHENKEYCINVNKNIKISSIEITNKSIVINLDKLNNINCYTLIDKQDGSIHENLEEGIFRLEKIVLINEDMFYNMKIERTSNELSKLPRINKRKILELPYGRSGRIRIDEGPEPDDTPYTVDYNS